MAEAHQGWTIVLMMADDGWEVMVYGPTGSGLVGGPFQGVTISEAIDTAKSYIDEHVEPKRVAGPNMH